MSNTTSNNKTTNIILGLMTAVMVFLGAQLHNMRNDANTNQEKLYTLMKSFYGHVWANDLKEEGRRLAVANHLQKQLDGDQYGIAPTKDLLKHGVDGITAYVDLSNGELMSWIKMVPAQSEVYGNLLTIRDYAPISNTKQLSKKPTKSSGEENAEVIKNESSK